MRDRAGERNRVLLVGAGRSGRSLARELNETPREQVVGFLDDNERLRRRRIQGVTVLGGLLDAGHVIDAARPDEVLVTIPDCDECASRRGGRRMCRRRHHVPIRPPRDDRSRHRRWSKRRKSESPRRGRRRDRGWTSVLAMLPLALIYLLAASLYAWQASNRMSPTIFSDEIEFTQISRSIAETGRAARLGEPYGFQTLYTFLMAPVWWIDDTKTAWEAAKLIGALVMSATLFPAYGLARLVVSRPWALFAAAGAVAVPPLAFAPYLMDEPMAYPVATLGLLADRSRDLRNPTRRSFALAAGVCTIAPFVRGELSVLWLVLLLSGAHARLARFPLQGVAVALEWLGLGGRGDPGHRSNGDAQRGNRAPLGGVVRRDRVLQAADGRALASGRSALFRSVSACSRWSRVSQDSASPPSDPRGTSERSA